MRPSHKKISLSLALLAALCTGTLAAQAQQRPDRGGPPPGQEDRQQMDAPQKRGEKLIERLARRLGLSSDQEKKLKDYAESRVKPLRKETMRLHREAGRATLTGDSGKADALHQQFLAKEAQLFRAQQDLGKELRGMLTAEQKQRLEEMSKKMDERMERGGPEGDEQE